MDFSPRETGFLALCTGFVAVLVYQRKKIQSLKLKDAKYLIGQHVSIRKFTNEPVSEALLQDIIQLAMQSSNNGNMQTYSIIITRDAHAKQKLALIHDNSAIAQAAVLLTFVADWSRMVRWCQLRDASPGYSNFNAFWTGSNDAMVTAQSVAFAAEAAGLGICYLGSTIWETRRLNEFFELPKHAHVVTSVMIGHPAETPKLRARLPMYGLTHQERYQPLSDSQVLESYKDRETEGWHRYMELYGPVWVQKLAIHKVENLAQVYTCLKYSSQDYRLWSRRQLDSLRKQGFMENEKERGDGRCGICGKWSHCLDPARFEYFFDRRATPMFGRETTPFAGGSGGEFGREVTPGGFGLSTPPRSPR